MNIDEQLIYIDEKSNIPTNEKNTYYKLYYNNEIINFWTPESLCPFGIENEYNKYILKVECPNNNIINYILKIEEYIKKYYSISDSQFKSCIRKKKTEKFNDIIICRLRTNRNNKINTIIDYKPDSTNYLKTVYELNKNIYLKCLLEISGVWDLREKYNKIGLVVTIKKILL
jgi:hypothetical protein